MTRKYYFDPDTIRVLLNKSPKEVFTFCMKNCDWEDARDLADIFSDLVDQIEFNRNEA